MKILLAIVAAFVLFCDDESPQKMTNTEVPYNFPELIKNPHGITLVASDSGRDMLVKYTNEFNMICSIPAVAVFENKATYILVNPKFRTGKRFIRKTNIVEMWIE